jgi:CPA2 family monovalent cation:H+ antiporter-2
LIVEDLAMVLALVLLPAIGGALAGGDDISIGSIAITIGVTIGKVALFIALMLVIGKRVIPWLLGVVAHSGSRELFRLAVLAITLGVAFGAAGIFGVSFELGAFFAGMMMGESKLAQRAAEETLPLRDAFAVLFFVSIGMLFNYQVLLTEPLVVLAALAIVVLGKSLAALLIVLIAKRPLRTALTIATSLAQIGEFSFILIGLGVANHLVSKNAQDVLLAAAILSILLNALLFKLLDRAGPWLDAGEMQQVDAQAVGTSQGPPAHSVLVGHVVLAGYGRIGQAIADALSRQERPLLVLEENRELLTMLHGRDMQTIEGNASRDDVLAAANLAQASALMVTVPDAFEGGEVVRVARLANPDLRIIARAESDDGATHLREQGPTSSCWRLLNSRAACWSNCARRVRSRRPAIRGSPLTDSVAGILSSIAMPACLSGRGHMPAAKRVSIRQRRQCAGVLKSPDSSCG